MQKLIVTEFMSLDGVMEAPETWSFAYWNEEASAYKHKELFATDALLLGRVTYEGFAAAWPGRTDETGFADRFNTLPKYVASTTLETADWNNSTVINGDVAQELARLKREPGQNMAVHGSATLVRALMEHDLIDEYRLLVYPLVLGTGKRLFGDSVTTKLKLVESQTFSTGVTALTYEPDRSADS
jgi:dihydrofolate reductase